MIWLIGNKGMLGSDIELLLSADNLEYIASDIEVDINDKDKIIDFIKDKEIKWIINAAAYTNVDGAESNKDTAFKVNADAVKDLAEISKEKDIKLIHFSTDYVFDGGKKIPHIEEDIPSPVNLYGESKLLGEEYIIKTSEKYFILRTSWLYGKNGKNFVNTIIRILKEKDKLEVVNDQYGSPTYSKNLAGVVVKIIKNDFEKYGIYQYTNDGTISWYDFAVEIYNLYKEEDILKKNVKIVPVSSDEFPTTAMRPTYSVLSKEKIKNELNIDVCSWKKSLKKFIREEVKNA